MFTVEALLERKKKRSGIEFLVKWAGYVETTWEPSKNIAQFIVKVLFNLFTFLFYASILVL